MLQVGLVKLTHLLQVGLVRLAHMLQVGLNSNLKHERLFVFLAVVSGGEAQSTISLLCHGRLFREAARLSRLFQLSCSPVLQSLASVCCLADNAPDKAPHLAWLKLNAGDSERREVETIILI